MEEVKRPSTGIPELDNILNDTEGLSIDPMPIDKKIFDGVILPLLKNELNISNDDSFTHLRNIWTNYYTNYSNNRAVIYKEGSGVPPKSMGGNAVFTPMAIKDISGNIVAITPPLLEPTLVVGLNAILEEYTNEMKHNPDVARVKLINTIRGYSISENKAWITFLSTYGNDGTTLVEDDDNDDLIIRS